MKVRTTFTLWIALVAFFSALLFSAFVYVELIEEPQKLLKREIKDMSDAILSSFSKTERELFLRDDTDYPLERYYVNLTDSTGAVIYESPLSAILDIPPRSVDGFYMVKRSLPIENIWIDPIDDDDYDEIKNDIIRFIVFQTTQTRGNRELLLLVAKPLALISAELTDLLQEIVAYIVLATIFVISFSYFLAGRLLEPLSKINEKIKTIREQSLDERIPLGKSRDELYTLATSLNTMFDRLHFSFKQQRDFLSSAAHELKIPLTSIMLSQEEMINRKLPMELQVDLERQLYSLQRLNRLIKDLLDISHLEHREFINKEPIVLSHLIERVLADFDDMLAAKGVQCTTKIERLSVLADHDRLIRVFINLIDNGIKYNLPSGGYLNICAKREKEKALITVANSSAKIPSADLPHIFKQFYRVEKSRASQFGGTGLGLTIVRRIIELHDGEIDAVSGEAETVFKILLPLADHSDIT